MPTPFNAAAALRNLRSPVNVTDAMGAFAPPDHSMSAFEQQGLDGAREMGVDALGAGSAFHALTQALDRNKFAHTTGELDMRDDLESGLPEDIAMGQAGIQNHVGDVLSEGGARRQLLPMASAVHQRDTGDAISRAQTQYGYPAQIKAQGDIEAARIGAQGRVEAAGAGAASLPMRGLIDAILAQINKSGKMPTPDEMAQFRALIANQPPGR